MIVPDSMEAFLSCNATLHHEKLILTPTSIHSEKKKSDYIIQNPEILLKNKLRANSVTTNLVWTNVGFRTIKKFPAVQQLEGLNAISGICQTYRTTVTDLFTNNVRIWPTKKSLEFNTKLADFAKSAEEKVLLKSIGSIPYSQKTFCSNASPNRYRLADSQKQQFESLLGDVAINENQTQSTSSTTPLSTRQLDPSRNIARMIFRSAIAADAQHDRDLYTSTMRNLSPIPMNEELHSSDEEDEVSNDTTIDNEAHLYRAPESESTFGRNHSSFGHNDWNDDDDEDRSVIEIPPPRYSDIVQDYEEYTQDDFSEEDENVADDDQQENPEEINIRISVEDITYNSNGLPNGDEAWEN
jgi:hypothetical protein